MPELFDKCGRFRKPHAFSLPTIVQLETLRFCRRFITHDHREAGTKFYDPKGRQYDQMTQAARSGRQNIIEGSERSATSKSGSSTAASSPDRCTRPRRRFSTPSRWMRPRSPTTWSTSPRGTRWISVGSAPDGSTKTTS